MENYNYNNTTSCSCKFKKTKICINFLLIIASITILIYFCIVNGNFIKLTKALPRLNFIWLTIAFFSIILSWYFDSKVIQHIAKFLICKKYTSLFFFKITMVGQYFTSLTPMGLAGQPLQVMELTKYGFPKKIALIIVTRKFFIYQFTLTIYSLVCTIIYYNQLNKISSELIPLLWLGILFQSLIMVLVLSFSINKKFTLYFLKISLKILSKFKIIKNPEKHLNSLENKLDFFIKSNKLINKNKKANLKLYVFNFLQITFLFLIPFFIFKAFGYENFPICEILCTQSIINAISSFNPLPGAAGTAEKGFLLLFLTFFGSNELAPSMIISRFISFYFAILIGMIFYKKSFKKYLYLKL